MTATNDLPGYLTIERARECLDAGATVHAALGGPGTGPICGRPVKPDSIFLDLTLAGAREWPHTVTCGGCLEWMHA